MLKKIDRQVILFLIFVAFALALCASSMIALGRDSVGSGVASLAGMVAMCFLADRLCSRIEHLTENEEDEMAAELSELRHMLEMLKSGETPLVTSVF